MSNFEQRIADALGTDERGEDLIEVAREAHSAEQSLPKVLEALQHIYYEPTEQAHRNAKVILDRHGYTK